MSSNIKYHHSRLGNDLILILAFSIININLRDKRFRVMRNCHIFMLTTVRPKGRHIIKALL